MVVSSVLDVSSRLVCVVTPVEVAVAGSFRQAVMQRGLTDVSPGVDAIRANLFSGENARLAALDAPALDRLRWNVGLSTEAGAESRDAIPDRAVGLASEDAPLALVQRGEIEDAFQQPNFAALASAFGSGLIADSIDTQVTASRSIAQEVLLSPRWTEVGPQDTAATGHEADLRVFERTYVIPVSFFVTSPSVPPLTLRRGAEPPTAARAFHGVIAGQAPSPTNPKRAMHGRTGSQAGFQSGEGTSSSLLDDQLQGIAALLSMPPFLGRVQDPCNAFLQPAPVGSVFDQQA